MCCGVCHGVSQEALLLRMLVCESVLQCMCCRVCLLECVPGNSIDADAGMCECVAMYVSQCVLQCLAVCCSVLQVL